MAASHLLSFLPSLPVPLLLHRPPPQMTSSPRRRRSGHPSAGFSENKMPRQASARPHLHHSFPVYAAYTNYGQPIIKGSGSNGFCAPKFPLEGNGKREGNCPFSLVKSLGASSLRERSVHSGDGGGKKRKKKKAAVPEISPPPHSWTAVARLVDPPWHGPWRPGGKQELRRIPGKKGKASHTDALIW